MEWLMGFEPTTTGITIRVPMPEIQELIDPENVIDRATFANPTLLSDGIDLVIVDGTITYRERQLTGNRAGRFLRRESRAWRD
jgi:N-acyl-D-aspartate/D-glutamate deacylase